jgi:hypothetical protein
MVSPSLFTQMPDNTFNLAMTTTNLYGSQFMIIFPALLITLLKKKLTSQSVNLLFCCIPFLPNYMNMSTNKCGKYLTEKDIFWKFLLRFRTVG